MGARVRSSPTADHPERMKLVFTTQLHHQMQTVARNREFSVVSGVGHGHATRGREVNGWEIEKKMVLLKELRPLLEQPFFLYADCGGQRVGSNGHANGGGGNSSSSSVGGGSFFSMDAYFNKTLPLATGQQSLLDLWEYLLDMCEHVPVRNRCRSLYLLAASSVCRRVEFIRGSIIDGDAVTIEAAVHDRYYALLHRCVQLCSLKLTQSRILLEENAVFTAQVFSVVCMRFPNRAGRVFDALLECAAVLEQPASGESERPRAHSAPPSHKAYSNNGCQRRDARECRSPRQTHRHWNGLTELERRGSEIRADERSKAILAAFSRYKLTRRSLATPPQAEHLQPFSISRRTVDRALCEALETDMERHDPITPLEAAFIMETPVLHAFSGGERQLVHRREPTFASDLDRALHHFTDRLSRPGRDDLLVVQFVSAFLRDRHGWCHAALASGGPRSSRTLLWHCVPGYFCAVRAFVAVVKCMCQRRPRTATTSQASVANVVSILEGGVGVADPWTAYWSPREVALVVDAVGDVTRNPRVLNVLVQVVFEGTNILDAASANYSLTVLQRVLEAAAKASGGGLGDAFDDVYFCASMRKALLSAHVQILLKTLTFLYSSLDLLPSRGRRRIISELVLREHFFRFFLHWNDEIRKIYCYIIVFKVFAANRLDLPCTADHILLAHSPFFPSPSTMGTTNSSSSAVVSPSFGYWFHLGDIAQSIIKAPTSVDPQDDHQRKTAAANALTNLMDWEKTAPVLTAAMHARPRRVSLFRASLEDEDASVDLLVTSKLDASLKMLADQVARHKASYFPVEQEAYVDRALAQYVHVLWEYYAAAMAVAETTAAKPASPKLEFTIALPFTSESGRTG